MMITPDEAVDFGEELVADLNLLREHAESGRLPLGAEEFAEEVQEKVEGIVEWIDTESHVTEKQDAALRGIRGGVDRWLERVR